MNYALFKSRLDSVLVQRNNARFFLVVLLGICSVQSIGLIYVGVLAHRSRVIERPVGMNTPFWVSGHGVSAGFLSGMARFITQLYLNVTPATVTASQHELLKYTAPSAYDAVKRVLVQMRAEINKEDLTSLFIMDEPQLNNAKLEAKITGELILKSGDTDTVTTHKTFVLTFTNADGQLLLTGLRELQA